jgi:metabolite-proton symporter
MTITADVTTTPTARATSPIAHVVWASVLGTAIEWYDFLIYGTAAALVFNRLFFPAFDPMMGTIAAFGTYAVGFVARPIGGAIIGHYGDRLGRKTMLAATLLIMGAGTFLIGCLPTYQQIGVWAPILLVALRFVQGIGLGGEWSGAVTMVAEHAGHRRGLWGSLVQVGFPAGVAASTAIFGLMSRLPEASFLSWGWRVPFLASIMMVAVGLFVRLRLAETPFFQELVARKELVRQPVIEVLRRDWWSFLLAVGITVSEVGLAYLLTVFVITYSTSRLALPREIVLNAVVYAALVEFITLPLSGWLSDLYGRKALYLTGALATIVLAFPLFWLLDTRDTTVITITMIVTMTMTHALLFGPKAAFMPELFGTRVRYSGASLGANVAAALSGGFSPVIATALLVWADASWAISLYIIALSLLSAAAVLATPETARAPLKP